jgi:hypothetical protein
MDRRRFEIKTRRSPSAKPANLQLMSKRMECFFLFKCRAHTDRADLHFFCGRGGFFLPESFFLPRITVCKRSDAA